MIIRLSVIGLSVLIVQACMGAPHNPHAVPVRVMGVPRHVQPRVVEPVYAPRMSAQTSVSRGVASSDPVPRHTATVPRGDRQIVSVSPYEGRRAPAQHMKKPSGQVRSHSKAHDGLRASASQHHSVTVASSQIHTPMRRSAPVVPAQTHNMSIADVIDQTIRNAPDLPIATATTDSRKQAGVNKTQPSAHTSSAQVADTIQPTPSKEAGHQPSKQELASLGKDKPRFYWPVRGNIISSYGSKGSGKQNDGINISAPRGTAVKAAAAGIVVYSGEDLGGLGHLILIRHSGNYHTAYAHVDNKLVKTGDRVALGQAIANVGRTGNVTTPQLHFEIREGKKPLNPENFLPRS